MRNGAQGNDIVCSGARRRSWNEKKGIIILFRYLASSGPYRSTWSLKSIATKHIFSDSLFLTHQNRALPLVASALIDSQSVVPDRADPDRKRLRKDIFILVYSRTGIGSESVPSDSQLNCERIQGLCLTRNCRAVVVATQEWLYSNVYSVKKMCAHSC